MVLHRGEEARHVVVDGGGVDVGDLALRQPDLANALELLLGLASAHYGAAALEALVAYCEALDGELLDDAGGPLAELHRAHAGREVADAVDLDAVVEDGDGDIRARALTSRWMTALMTISRSAAAGTGIRSSRLIAPFGKRADSGSVRSSHAIACAGSSRGRVRGLRGARPRRAGSSSDAGCGCGPNERAEVKPGRSYAQACCLGPRPRVDRSPRLTATKTGSCAS